MSFSLIKIGLAFGALYLMLLLGLFFGQKRLVYIPDRTRIAPEAVGLENVDEVVFRPDGAVRLLAWYAKPRPGRPTILYFHGNAGNLAGRTDRIRVFKNAGYGIIVMSYRGYSGGTGSPSEAANISDGLHVYDWLVSNGTAAGDVVLYGESLGSGVATQVAVQRHIAGLILDAPFSSLVEVAQRAYPFVPVGPFLKERYQSDGFIDLIDVPLLILHGARDQVIPVEFGQSLFETAKQPKKIVVFPKGNHSDLFEHGAFDRIRDFLETLPR